MKEHERSQGRRVLTQYGAEGRERLMKEQAESGLSKVAFCAARGINLGTFYGWGNKSRSVRRSPAFAQVELSKPEPASIEVLLPNGVRIGIHQPGRRDELVALVRGVAGC